MNHSEIDMLVVGASVGTVAGSWLGYQLRKIVERVRLHHTRRVAYHDGPDLVGRSKPHEQDARAVMREKRQPIPVIPLEPRRSRKQTPAPAPVDPDREEAVEALVGSGYKKTEAARAVDACSPEERGDGDLAKWIVSALRHAAGAK